MRSTRGRMLSAPNDWRTQIKPRLLLAGGGQSESPAQDAWRKTRLGKKRRFPGLRR